jgi:hypothetical protein
METSYQGFHGFLRHSDEMDRKRNLGKNNSVITLVLKMFAKFHLQLGRVKLDITEHKRITYLTEYNEMF